MNQKKITASCSAKTLAGVNKSQSNNSTSVVLTQHERMKAIIGAYRNGHITQEQANSLIKDLCTNFFNWRIK